MNRKQAIAGRGSCVMAAFGTFVSRRAFEAVHQERWLLMSGLKHPVTPDGRYFAVRGRLWRLANPAIAPALKEALVHGLMDARRAVKDAKAAADHKAEAAAHKSIDAAKRALGERGPVWWTDGSPDYNRHMAKNTPYAAWYAETVRRRHKAKAA